MNTLLAWINEQRAARGLDPIAEIPKGTRSGLDCPLARALECTDYVGTTYARYGAVLTTLPQFAQNFVADFDAGRFPELELA